MTDKEEKKRILIKKVNAGHHDGAHGGAWKIAYADFVTAMMAFFLLMWLLNSVEEDKLQGIAEYFQTPISEMGKGGPGLTNTARIVDAGGGDKQSSKAGEIQGRPNAILKDSQASSDTDKAQLEALKKNLEETIMLTPTLAPFKNQIKIEITDEGLRIQILDEKNRPMFDIGSIKLKPYTSELLKMIGKTLNQVDNKVVISGHTDATPYSESENDYSNWELSTERANTARRSLISGGMDENKILRIVGVASTNLFDKNDPYNATNRRISILVLDKRKEALLKS